MFANLIKRHNYMELFSAITRQQCNGKAVKDKFDTFNLKEKTDVVLLLYNT